KGKWNATAIIRDITERKQAQNELKNYANTQKVLLQEVNHRVKNNLTAILGLLQIEEAKIKNKAYLNFINEFKGRIYGLSTVHSLLAKNNWQPLNLNLLCNKIINSSIDCLHCSNIFNINISPSTVMISSNQAYHLTLIINELITNSVKYGQNNKHEILINVDIKKDKENVIITYRDTGKGYPKKLIEKNFSNTGVGFDLIKGIVTHSLNGKLQIYNDNGAVTVFKFKPDEEM
ncbi:MAG: sensor histidine kinase, partial [Bacteroidales bacterium]|nr:sensor histidine kinase [Bacteroidales bacterium]